MPAPLDVCVRGAGVVGRTLALLLARERLRVGVVESPATAEHAATDVRAYAMNAASRDLLTQLRAWPAGADVTPVSHMEVHGDEGGHVHFRSSDLGTDALAWIVAAGALMRLLGEALRFAPSVELLSEPRSAALTVVCEGKASDTRAQFGVQMDTTHYVQHAIAARLSCERPHGEVARQWFGDCDILALLPMGGVGGNSAALVWSVRHDRADELMALPATAFEEKVTAASHGALGALTLQGDRARWPLSMSQAQRWCGPGWVLAGDAAHTVHPLAGQGLNLGLADARELARVLREREYWRELGDERLLRRYERARKADVAVMQYATDGLQKLFDQEFQPLGWLRNWGMRAFDAAGPLKNWAARQAAGRF